ncbi:MAG TPA: tyrosine-type recombinase/integrase [Ktedonosporobacter sp.]|nr:tyrosine-type recombinase/integrase [Ktedonosporobacter sp.]
MSRPTEGSVYQRKSGDKRWVGSFPVENGKRKYVYAKTKKEAKDKLKKAMQDYEQGRLVAATPVTVAAYLPEWLRVYSVTANLKPSTVVSYRQRFRRIFERFGPVKLQKVTTEMIQTWLVDLLEEGLAAKTVRSHFIVLSMAMREAYEHSKISLDPCDRVKVPKTQKYTGLVLTPVQAGALVVHAKESRLAPMLTVALGTGMRKGELRSLRWDDVDLEKRTLQVRRNVAYLPDNLGKYHHVEGTPKSEAGKRPIDLPQFVVEALRTHHAQQAEARLAAGPRWENKNLVFCNRSGGYYNLTVLYRQFKRLLKSADLPEIRFHDLRHSAATILIAMGVHVKVVSELLGHSSVAITLGIYSHVLPGMQREAMNDLDALYRQNQG